MTSKPSARRISLKRRKWMKFRRKLMRRSLHGIRWLSADALEKWEKQQESQNKLKHKPSRRRGSPWYRHRDPWKLELKKLGWFEVSPFDPTLTDSEFESALYWEAKKNLERAKCAT